MRLNRLQDVKVRRQAQPAGSPNRMDAACRLIPQVIEAHHGYHIACYKRFTGNLNRLNVVETVQEPSTSSTRSKRNPSEKILFDPDCIFCNSTHLKRVKNGNTWIWEKFSVFDKTLGKTVQKLAE